MVWFVVTSVQAEAQAGTNNNIIKINLFNNLEGDLLIYQNGSMVKITRKGVKEVEDKILKGEK